MEEKEIIKTDDPNILIERTTIEREVNIKENTLLISALTSNLEVINQKIDELSAITGMPEIVQTAIERQIAELNNEANNITIDLIRLENYK